MRIACIGAGPGGLYFAARLKELRPAAEIVVFDRNPRDATYGFGVVFSRPTLERLAVESPETVAAMRASGAEWDDIEIRRNGQRTRVDGNGFLAIARMDLLRSLQERAIAAGVELRFERQIDGLDGLDRREWDLIVGADGAASVIREQLRGDLGPVVTEGRALYIWFATRQKFDALTFSFIENEHGAFGLHAYPFGDGQSTFIVETDLATWRRAGLDHAEWDRLGPGQSDDVATDYCTRVFGQDLNGAQLLRNNSKWLRFGRRSCDRWSSGNVVLIGDAIHTAHFSVGSGTKMAMDDASELAACVDELGPGSEALGEFESRRRVWVERTQALAEPSQVWWEEFSAFGDMSNERFGFHFLTRTLAVSAEDLAERAPVYMDGPGRLVVEEVPPDVYGLDAPIEVGELRLKGRIVQDASEVFNEVDLDAGLSAALLAESSQPNLVVANRSRESAIRRIRVARDHNPGERPICVTIGIEAVGIRSADGAAEVTRELFDSGADLLCFRPDADAGSRQAAILLSDHLKNSGCNPIMLDGVFGDLASASTAILAGRVDLVTGVGA